MEASDRMLPVASHYVLVAHALGGDTLNGSKDWLKAKCCQTLAFKFPGDFATSDCDNIARSLKPHETTGIN